MPGARKVIDCRNFTNEKTCTIAISGNEEEALDLAVVHAVFLENPGICPAERSQ
jgi:hypothetical protein